jgi:nitrate reductase NapAB chaperone NapD
MNKFIISLFLAFLFLAFIYLSYLALSYFLCFPYFNTLNIPKMESGLFFLTFLFQEALTPQSMSFFIFFNEKNVLFNSYTPKRYSSYSNLNKINYLNREMIGKKYTLDEYKVDRISKYTSLNIKKINIFLSKLNENKVYVLFPLLFSNNNILSISRQILIVKNINSQLLLNFIEKNIEILQAKHYPVDFNNSNILFKYRIIKIESHMKEEEIIKNLSESTFEKSPLDSVKFHQINTNSLLLKGEIIPYNMKQYGYKIDLKSYFFSKLISKNKSLNLDKNNDLFSPLGKSNFNYLIYLKKKYVKNGELIHECILFKKYIEYIKFKDISQYKNNIHSISTFLRKLDNLSINIKNEKIVSLQSDLKFKYIKPLNKVKKIDNILNKNIVTFDIETYQDKNKIFVPYACG